MYDLEKDISKAREQAWELIDYLKEWDRKYLLVYG